MKTRYLFQVSALLLGIVMMSGCVQWPEFEPIDVDSAPTVTITLVSAADSTITVDVTSSMNGFVAAIILADTGNVVPSDPESLLTGDVSYDDYAYAEAEATVANQFTFSGVQNTMYEIMAVAANEDGVVSTVEVLVVTTDDSYAPMLVGGTPAFSYTAQIEPEGTVVVTFNEPVLLGDGDFSIETFNGGDVTVIPAANLSVSGASVSIVLPAGPAYRDYIWLHWEEGAVTDLAGNEVAEWTTFYDEDEGVFIGAFWRMMAFTYEVTTIAPDEADPQDAGFDIVLTFDDVAKKAAALVDGSITLSYDDGAGMVVTVDVPAADVTASGNTITIAQTVYYPSGGTVTVTIPTGLLTVGYGNPVAEITAAWDINPAV